MRRAVRAERPLTLAEMERWYIRHVVEISRGCISEAARVLGLHRRTLQRKLKRRP